MVNVWLLCRRVIVTARRRVLDGGSGGVAISFGSWREKKFNGSNLRAKPFSDRKSDSNYLCSSTRMMKMD